jgi:hypothetical protein
MKEKREGFYGVPISEWEQIHAFQADGWIYRGQKDSTKPLETTLERTCENYGAPEVSLEKASVIEDVLLREFKRKYHHYSQHIPYRRKTLEWLSLMQHYGAPTRLLDFTYSVYVAAYFALEEALGPEEVDKGYAVWAINVDWATKESAKLFEEEPKVKEYFERFIEEEKEKLFEKAFRRPDPKMFACPQNPFMLNERLTIQKGIFMCPGDVTKPFEDNLCNLQGWKEKQNVVEIIISRQLRRKALDKLYDMNISRAALFPRLDGFTQSLKVSFPKRWDRFTY